MQKSSDTLKRVTLELGGKSPNIVFEDADLDAAVPGSLFGIFFNTGQSCEARSRMFVHESIYDDFMEQFIAKTKSFNQAIHSIRAPISDRSSVKINWISLMGMYSPHEKMVQPLRQVETS